MKKLVLALLSASAVLAFASCEGLGGGERMVKVELSDASSVANAAGDLPYSFAKAGNVGYYSDAPGNYGPVSVSPEGTGRMSGSFEVSSKATSMWCFTTAEDPSNPAYSLPSVLTLNDPAAASSMDRMVFCTDGIALSRKETSYSATVKPVTSAVVLDIMDSRGKQCGKPFTQVTVKGSDDVSLAGDFKLRVQESRIGEISNTSSTLEFNCSSGAFTVGTADKPASIGTVVLPCVFKGTVTIVGDGFKAIFTLSDGQPLQAGYIKHIKLDLADAQIEGEKHLPLRLGILGDSISTFKGIIPSSHRAYYPTTNAACADVDSWEKTYWGHLVNDYWHCELDVNSAWSGSCVAAGDPTVVRTPFVERCSLFQNPDVIILFGGTNDCQPERKIALGSFDYTSSPDKLNKYARFRESYIWVIKTLQANYPEAQIICIVGNHIDGEYGNSVKSIAETMGLPYVDFRGDQKVTLYEQLHPNAAGHAHMAQRIYEETLYLFQ